MEVWFPGTEAGSAIANVLYGDASPTGKLPMSFPRAVGQEPLYYNQFPTGRPALDTDLTPPPEPGTRFLSRYIDVPNDALFPFGYGLSYSQASYAAIGVSRSAIPIREAQHKDARKLITVTATVKNEGSRSLTEVVQCYVGNRGASLEQPMRSLKGFTRVTLKPGERTSLTSFSPPGPDGMSIISLYPAWTSGVNALLILAAFQVPSLLSQHSLLP
jgi:beta-glucosidase